MSIKGIADGPMVGINRRADTAGVFRYSTWWQGIWDAFGSPEEFYPSTASEARAALIAQGGGGGAVTDTLMVTEANQSATWPLYIGGAINPSGIDNMVFAGGFGGGGRWILPTVNVGSNSMDYGQPVAFFPTLDPTVAFFNIEAIAASPVIENPGSFVIPNPPASVSAGNLPISPGTVTVDGGGAQATLSTLDGPTLPGSGADILSLCVNTSEDEILPNGAAFVLVDDSSMYEISIVVLPLSYEVRFGGVVVGAISKVTSGPILYAEINLDTFVLTYGNGRGFQESAPVAPGVVSAVPGLHMASGAAGEPTTVFAVIGLTGTVAP